MTREMMHGNAIQLVRDLAEDGDLGRVRLVLCRTTCTSAIAASWSMPGDIDLPHRVAVA